MCIVELLCFMVTLPIIAELWSYRRTCSKARRAQLDGLGLVKEWTEVVERLQRGEGSLVVIRGLSHGPCHIWNRDRLSGGIEAMDVFADQEGSFVTVPPLLYFISDCLLSHKYPYARIVRIHCGGSSS